MNGEPALMLWAWESPENLTALSPKNAGVAFLSRELTLGRTVQVRPRRQPLRIAEGAWLMAVVRLQTAPDFAPSAALEQQAASEILAAMQAPNIRALQVDFDATASQRDFYASVLRKVAAQKPSAIPLSMTALVSWCGPRSWLRTLPSGVLPIAANGFSANHESTPPSAAQPLAIRNWYQTRAAIGGPLKLPSDSSASSRSVPGDPYQTFDNCLDDAYANATRTLQARVASYGAKNPEVAEWLRGQDAVFSNCAGSGSLPASLTTGSLWVRQDRAYQIAAARFYAMDYPGALGAFRAIAADAASPWNALSRYLEARTFIRAATVPENPISGNSPTPAEVAASKRHFTEALTRTRDELLAMRAEPRMAPLRDAIDDMLDYVNFNLQPEQQSLVLAARIRSPHPRNLAQALIDLSFIRTLNDPDDNYPTDDPTRATPQEREKIRAAARSSSQRDAADLLDWMDAVNQPVRVPGDPHNPVARWHATHTTAWLLAAMMSAQPGDAAAPELVEAASHVAPDDPAYVALTYHRFRLSPRSATTRSQLLAVLPAIEKSSSVSTINLFKSLDAATAPALEAWLAQAPRGLSAESDDDQSGAVDYEIDPCSGEKIPAARRRLFDTDGAAVLNTDFPLRLLAQAASSPGLPENLRLQVAQAAWARAVLLNQPGIASRMSPLLLHCRAAWQPVLDAYNHATTADNRRAEGLLALMRFASTEPSVREGEARREGFATYDEYRQNWWCTTVPEAGGTVDDITDPKHSPPPPAPTPPAFLTAADLAEAHAEVAELRKIPMASTYFAQQALAWRKLHPADSRTPEILGKADRVLRNACRNDPPDDPKTGRSTLDPHDMNLTPNLEPVMNFRLTAEGNKVRRVAIFPRDFGIWRTSRP